MKKLIIVGERTLEYEFVRKNVRNINIRVRPDGTVLVSAGPRVPELEVRDFVVSKAARIFDALNRYRLESMQTNRPDFLSVFGDEKRISVVYGKRGVTLLDHEVVVSVPDTSDEQSVFVVLEKWKKEFFLSACKEICTRFFPYFESEGAAFPEIRVRMMKSRWGSCIARKNSGEKGIVTLNLRLLSYPLESTELVAAHELSHLLCHGHNAAFYAVLSDVLPDHAERKKRLNGR